MKEIMIGSGVLYQFNDIYTTYAGVAERLLHINGKFTMAKLK
jgi:hypothetical protein